MNNGTLTYGQLHRRLSALGFAPHAVAVDGKRGQMFLHKTLAHAMIVLPERKPSDPVEPFYLNSVLATLKAHDLLPESNPLLT